MEPEPPEFTGLFQDGPFPHITRSLALFRAAGGNIRQRTINVVVLGWVPLLILVGAQSALGESQIAGSFLRDIAIHSRSLLGAALLVLSEAMCLFRLERIVEHFPKAGLITESDRPVYSRIVATSKWLINSTAVEIVVVAVAYGVTFYLIKTLPSTAFPAWYHVSFNGTPILSWAGFWAVFVSIPLFLILLIGWLWRVLVWARFISKVSRLRLRLVAAHPDLAAGLKFLNSQLLAFVPVAFSFGVVTAGALADRVLDARTGEIGVERIVGTLLGLVLILFAGPLVIMSRNLIEVRVKGVYMYGKLADEVGRQFEEKWLHDYELKTEGVLEVPDFSATTDLYQVVSNVHQMKLLPFEVRSVVTLCVATLVPFLPVLLMILPLKLIVHEAISLLL